MGSLAGRTPVVCCAGPQCWRPCAQPAALHSNLDIAEYAVQGPDAGVHVHSLHNLTAAGSAGMFAAPGCQAVAFSPTGELLAVAEGQPSCRLALWDWQQVGGIAQLLPSWNQSISVAQIRSLVGIRWVALHSSSLEKSAAALLKSVCRTGSSWLTRNIAMRALVTLCSLYQQGSAFAVQKNGFQAHDTSWHDTAQFTLCR